MIHLLPAHTSRVDDQAKTVRRALLAREAGRRYEDLAQQRLVAGVAVGERRDVLLGDDHEVHRGDRMDVVEREEVRVLVDFAARDLAPDDLAEHAARSVRHLRSALTRRLSARAAFSSIPDMPSRRRSSASTSAGRRPNWASMIRQ